MRGGDGSLTVVCRGAVVRWHPAAKRVELLGGGFGGYASFEAGKDGTLWVFNQVGPLHGGSITLTRLGDRPGDEQRHDIPFPSAERAVWLAPARFFLSANGHSTVLDLAKAPATTQDDWIASAIPNPRAAAAPDEHTVLTAGTRSSLTGFLYRYDLRSRDEPAELLELTVNRVCDLTVSKPTPSGSTLWLLTDVQGNNLDPRPLLVEVHVPAAFSAID